MAREKKTVTREQLYEQVWEMPMSQLAKEYGLSDVGLAKICKKLDIFFSVKTGYFNQPFIVIEFTSIAY